jgi:hypothetical protein
VGDLDLLRALVVVGAADPAGVEQVDLESQVSSSSSSRLACEASFSNQNGLVPGTRRFLPASAAPPAEVPLVSPSMK